MKGNMKTAVTSELYYADPDAARDWLSKVFGFTKGLVVRDSTGTIVFSEMEIDGGVVAVLAEHSDFMRSPKAAKGMNTQSVQIRFTLNIDDHYAHAVKNGAVIVSKPETYFFGDRSYLAADIEGHIWSFGQRIDNSERPPPEGWTIEFP